MAKKNNKLKKVDDVEEYDGFTSDVEDDVETPKQTKKGKAFDEVLNKVIILQEMYDKLIENDKYDKSICEAYVNKISELIQLL